MAGIETTSLPWQIAGSYLEACNCEAICPCRTIGGSKGGRSTEGICLGSLSWQIDEGTAGEADLAGHHQRGREIIADRLAVADGALDFELTGKCGYESDFADSSEDA